MRKAICPKCNHLISVDENAPQAECPNCHELILVESSLKNYVRYVSLLNRRGEIAVKGYTNYEKGYEYYSNLLNLCEEDLNALMWTVISRIYCSNLHKIYVKEATDILIKGSEKITINSNNIIALGDSLNKIKDEIKLLVNSFASFKEESGYALGLYRQALNEYKYYLEHYLKIVDALGSLNKYLKDSKEIISDDIKNVDELIKEKIVVKNKSNEKHDFYDKENKIITNIYPNKKKIFKIRMMLYGVMGVGAITSIVGFILMGVTSNMVARGVTLGLGLSMFIGGYFAGHKLKSINYNLKY